jgi:GTP cyclohydrolase I
MGIDAVSRAVSWQEIYRRLSAAPPGRLYGIPRGGAIIAGLTGRAVDSIEDADYLVDDLADGAGTMQVIGRLAGKPTWALFRGDGDGMPDCDVVFPWDDPAASREERLVILGRELLRTLGYDLQSESLRETPQRWAQWWTEFLEYDAGRTSVTFDSVTDGQLLVVSGIHVWSVCEHHLLPFEVDVSIGYLPAGHLLGLSKFARLTQAAAHKLQLQERLVEDVAGEIRRAALTDDVAVLGRGRHLCMEARGPKTAATTTSLSTSGRFRRRSRLRADFLRLAQVGASPSAGSLTWSLPRRLALNGGSEPSSERSQGKHSPSQARVEKLSS